MSKQKKTKCMRLDVPDTFFRVIFVPKSESRPNFYSEEAANEDTVLFYDRRYPHTPDGEFITSYYATTLLDSHLKINGLNLYGGEPDWIVNPSSMEFILEWVLKCTYSTNKECAI